MTKTGFHKDGCSILTRYAVWVHLFFVAPLLSACLIENPPEITGTDSGIRWVLAAGFDNIESIYIKPLEMSTLVIDGLRGLKQIDPNIELAQDKDSVTLSIGTSLRKEFNVPKKSDSSGWADFAAEIIGVARTKSSDLSRATDERIFQAIFDGALGDLDRFSRYASAEIAQENRANREGAGGVGITVDLKDHRMMILSILDGSPAESADIHPGDTLLAVDGVSTDGLSPRDVVRLIRGKVNSETKLTLQRDGRTDNLIVAVKRSLIVPSTVTQSIDKDILSFKISGFNQDTAASLSRYLRDIKTTHPTVQGAIIDLRGNPGGLLDQAVSVSDLFLDNGHIVSTRGRHPDSVQLFDAEKGDLLQNLPLVILIDGTSASAAEIVAAALQDRGRAVLVGTSSFGKGTVQTVIRLPNDGELTLTWAHFHAPSSYSINTYGVFPTVCTSTERQSEADLMAALKRGHLINQPNYTARRNAENLDDAARSTLLKECPWVPGKKTETDWEVARLLIANPQLYAQALQSAAAVTTRP